MEPKRRHQARQVQDMRAVPPKTSGRAGGSRHNGRRPAALDPTTPPTSSTTDSSFSSVFSLLAYLEDRNEKTRVAAAGEARYAIERAGAEARAAQERYRADLEFQLERERLSSKERIAQIEAQT